MTATYLNIKEYKIPLDCDYCHSLELHCRIEFLKIGDKMLNTYECSHCFGRHKRERNMKQHNDETLLYFKKQ